MKVKGFYIAKDTIALAKRKSTEWIGFFSSYPSDIGLLSKLYKELKKFSIEKTDHGMEMERGTEQSSQKKRNTNEIVFRFIIYSHRGNAS